MSSLRPRLYDLEDFKEYVDLKRFQYSLCAYSGSVLAIATEGSLILTDDSSGEEYDSTRLVLEFNEDSGRASCIQWIIEGEVVAVGFESGLVVCFNCKGEEIWEFKGATSCVQSIKVASTAIHKTGAAMWLLYEEGLLVSFPVGQVLDGNVTTMAVYRLANHKQLHDFVFFPYIHKASVFELEDVVTMSGPPIGSNSGKSKSSRSAAAVTHTSPALLSVFSAGSEASWALYNLGGALFSQEGEKSSATVRESAVNLLSKGVMSLYNWYGGSSDANSGNQGGGSSSNGGGGGTASDKKSDAARVQESTLTVTARIEFLDPKRRILKLSADPSGSFIAAADILGRVTLFDCTICAIIRIWKGLRHAEFAWTSRPVPPSNISNTAAVARSGNSSVAGSDSATVVGQANTALLATTAGAAADVIAVEAPSTNLVIHAPLLGLVYIYSMPHGPCVRIIPVGLNCHVFTLNASSESRGFGSAEQSSAEVRAYLLKPSSDPGVCKLELSEIRPADQAETDLDVRLTLVGTEVGTEDADEDDGEDYLVGEGGLEGDEVEGEPGATGSRNRLMSGEEAEQTSAAAFPRMLHPSSTGGGGSSGTTEANAMRNIEQSLQILAEAMPMSALRQSSALAGFSVASALLSGALSKTAFPGFPISKELFDIAVERAEESLLELLSAHKSVLGMNALYKCLTMVECMELYGELTPPPYATTADRAEAEALTLAALRYALTQYASAAGGASAAAGGRRNSGRLDRGNSSNSLLSLTSDLSAYNTPGPSSPRAYSVEHGSNAGGSGKVGVVIPALGNLAGGLSTSVLVGLMRRPAFSTHLHKTLVGLLSDAIAAHEHAGQRKYQYDVSKGEVTHLPAHILQRLKSELPIRERYLSAYKTFQDLGVAADRARAENSHKNAGFSALQTLNLRQLFDRSASTLGGAAGTPGGSQYSAIGTVSPMPALSMSSLASSTPVSQSVVHATGGRTLDDEITALCKLTTVRAEATMWVLRAAQNAEMQAARDQAVVKAQGQGGAAVTESDRLMSADSGTSVLSRASLLLGSVGIRTATTTGATSLTPSQSADNLPAGNSHSKVRRIAGRDAVPGTPTGEMTLPAGESDPSSSFPYFPTEYSRRNPAADPRVPRLGAIRGDRSRSGSSTGSESRLVDNSSDDLSLLSFSVFRAFHLAHRSGSKTSPAHLYASAEFALFFAAMSPHTPAEEWGQFCTEALLSLVLRTERAPNGQPWSALTGPVAQDAAALTGASGWRAASSGVSSVSSPGFSTPKQSSFRIAPAPGAAGLTAAQAGMTAGDSSAQASTTATLLHLPVARVESLVARPSSSAGSAGHAFTLLWEPTYLAPHALLNFLVTPLTGDIFSLSSLHEALKTMGIQHKLMGLKHMAPLFCAHLARQSAAYLLTEVLVKKLSTFPFQRWLRDALLTFQDSLTAAETQRVAEGGRTVSLASVQSTDTSRTISGGPRPAATASAEHDARDVSRFMTKLEEAAKERNSREASIDASLNRSASCEEPAEGGVDDTDMVFALAAEVRHCAEQSAGSAPEHTGHGDTGHAALPSYNDFIRHILRPAWLYAHQCSNLEAVLTFCAFVVETLNIVNDQVERRTYGAHSLKGTILAWESLVRQARLVLLLRSRSGDKDVAPGSTVSGASAGDDLVEARHKREFAVRNVSTGSVSLHRLLATDTLGFAVRAEQALEHEEKCRDVYAKSSIHRRPSQMSSTGAAAAGSSPEATRSAMAAAVKSEVLLAWGAVADKRWRDLLAVAVAEDAIHAALQGDIAGAASSSANPGTALSSSPSVSAAEQARRAEEQKRTLKRRRPLLLYFPLHSQAHLLGAYRSIILAERWSHAIHRVDLLVCACQHLFSLPQTTWRAAVAAHIYMSHILPVFRVFIALEEDAQLLAVASAGASLTAVEIETIRHSRVHAGQIQQLLKLSADMRLLKAFVNTAAEVLGYIELSLHSLQQSAPAKGHQHNAGGGAGGSAKGGAAKAATLWDHADVQDALYATRQAARRSAFDDEQQHAIWPPQEDSYLNNLLVKYARDVHGHRQTAPSVGNTAASAGGKALWTASAVAAQISMWWVMHLRSLCALKGVKPTEVLGPSVLASLQGFADRYEVPDSEDAAAEKSTAGATAGPKRQPQEPLSAAEINSSSTSTTVQMEFLTQCLRQLVLARQPTGAVYILAMRWIGMAALAGEGGGASASRVMVTGRHSSSPAPAPAASVAAAAPGLSMDTVRLRHLSILLATGGGSRDEEVEQMVPQISDTDLVLDTLIEALRRRLGLILYRIDQLPAYGPLIAAMDAEAVIWARSAVTATVGGGGGTDRGSLGVPPLGAMSVGHALDYDNGLSPTAEEGESDLVGICWSLNINVASTRHLIICVQSNLLNVPANMRRASANAPEEAPALSSGGSSASTTWFQRKTRCDALLTLCKYFAQQVVVKQQN